MNSTAERRLTRFFSCLSAVLLVLGIGACTSPFQKTDNAQQQSQSKSGDQSDSSSGSNAGARSAGSFNGYIDFWLGNASLDPPVSKEQRTVLERAKQSGSLNVSDYEHSWSQYKQCMLDKGYKEILLKKYSNGMYVEEGHVGGSEKQERQYDKDRDTCFNTYLMYVQDVFATQQGNPNFYSDTGEGLVDCLKRSGLVEKNYTAKRFGVENQSGDYSYDTNNPEAKSCEVANYVFRSSQDDRFEQLW
jgi:hypothetical protein